MTPWGELSRPAMPEPQRCTVVSEAGVIISGGNLYHKEATFMWHRGKWGGALVKEKLDYRFPLAAPGLAHIV